MGLKNIVVASSTGFVGKASEIFKGYNLIVLGTVVGYQEPDRRAMSLQNRNIIEKNGGKVIHAVHSFGLLAEPLTENSRQYK
ncbi:MAG: hypothetical protein QG670_928 [Thermoproteota archaeon]|nr:hypothetical protein [Thermoproteota archaeon]